MGKISRLMWLGSTRRYSLSDHGGYSSERVRREGEDAAKKLLLVKTKWRAFFSPLYHSGLVVVLHGKTKKARRGKSYRSNFRVACLPFARVVLHETGNGEASRYSLVYIGEILSILPVAKLLRIENAAF